MTGRRGRRSRKWAERTLQKYGMRLLIVARFVPGGRTAVTITAGLTHYDRRRFVPGQERRQPARSDGRHSAGVR